MLNILKDVRVAILRQLMQVFANDRVSGAYRRAVYSRGHEFTMVGELKADFVVSTWNELDRIRGSRFEKEQISEFLDNLKPDDVVYEVGAHVGTWSCFIAQKLQPKQLCCLEPAPANRQRLQHHLERNGLQGVVVSDIAAADQRGTATFGLSDDPDMDGMHSLVLASERSQTLQVPTVAVDELPDELNMPEPTCMKIDCEGGEAAVVRGMTQTLAGSTLRMIHIELHPEPLSACGTSPEQVLQPLLDAGFSSIRQWKRSTEQVYLLRRG